MSDPKFAWLGDDAGKLNGASSFRSAVTWRFEQEGDAVAGEVVRVERSKRGNVWSDGEGPAIVTLRVHCARSGGEEIESGRWMNLWMNASELRKAWEQVGGVRACDRIIVGYEGQQPYNARGSLKHVFSFGLERAEGAAVEEVAPRW